MIKKITDLKEAECIPQSELTNLVKLAKEGCQKSRNRIFLSHTRMVVNIANTYWKKCNRNKFEFGDLFSVGFINFGKAIDQFKPETGASFTSYLKIWINQSIRLYLKEQETTIVVGQHIKDKLVKSGEMFSIVSSDTTAEDGVRSLIDTIPQKMYQQQDVELIEMEREAKIKDFVEFMFEIQAHKPNRIRLIKRMYGFEDDICLSSVKAAQELNISTKGIKGEYACFRDRFKKNKYISSTAKKVLEIA